MSDDGLSNEERLELEHLRREKAERERALREREELVRLRREQGLVERERAEELRVRELRSRGARLMEPDDDLRMPLGQKVVLLGLLAAVVAIAAAFLLGR